MYTEVVRKKQQPRTIAVDKPTPLGRFMYRWRLENELTVEAAAERIDVVKSTWSNLENGKRKPEAETLLLLERETKVPFAELAKMADYEVRQSVSAEHRAQRVAAIAEASPPMAALIDLLPGLKPDQVDTLVTLAEDMHRRNAGS